MEVCHRILGALARLCMDSGVPSGEHVTSDADLSYTLRSVAGRLRASVARVLLVYCKQDLNEKMTDF